MAFHRSWIDALIFALALAVGLTPELLPMIMTVTLARGAVRLSHQRVIVKSLPAIYNLGAIDVLCTDKTGTLTEAHIALTKHVDIAGNDSARVLTLAWLNSHFESGLKSPLDNVILAHGTIDPFAVAKIDEVPSSTSSDGACVRAGRTRQCSYANLKVRLRMSCGSAFPWKCRMALAAC